MFCRQRAMGGGGISIVPINIEDALTESNDGTLVVPMDAENVLTKCNDDILVVPKDAGDLQSVAASAAAKHLFLCTTKRAFVFLQAACWQGLPGLVDRGLWVLAKGIRALPAGARCKPGRFCLGCDLGRGAQAVHDPICCSHSVSSHGFDCGRDLSSCHSEPLPASVSVGRGSVPSSCRGRVARRAGRVCVRCCPCCGLEWV